MAKESRHLSFLLEVEVEMVVAAVVVQGRHQRR